MATKKSTPGTRSLEALHDYIETQRSRLMDAEAVLDCMLHALDDDGGLNASGPSYPNIVRIVRELIHSTIDQLDSVNVKAAIAREVSAEMPLGVKEEPAAYVH